MKVDKEIVVKYEVYDEHFVIRRILHQDKLTGNYAEINGRIFVEYQEERSFLWFKWHELIKIPEDSIIFLEITKYSCKES